MRTLLIPLLFACYRQGAALLAILSLASAIFLWPKFEGGCTFRRLGSASWPLWPE